MSQNNSRRQIVEQLTQQLRRLERSQHIACPPRAGQKGERQTGADRPPETIVPAAESPERRDAGNDTEPVSTGVVSTGVEGFDRLLPEKGLRRGTLVEWFAEGQGSGAGTLAITAARQAMHDRGVLVVIDPAGDFYAPAAASCGIDLNRMIVVRPAKAADVLWAYDQSLRCAGVAAVLCEMNRLNDRAFRRLQLAAERGGSLGLLLRPASLRQEPSWADVRLFVQPQAGWRVAGSGWREDDPSHHPPPAPNPVSQSVTWEAVPQAELLFSPLATRHPPPITRLLRVEVLRCRGGISGQTVNLEVDDETGVVRLVSELVPAAVTRRASRA